MSPTQEHCERDGAVCPHEFIMKDKDGKTVTVKEIKKKMWLYPVDATKSSALSYKVHIWTRHINERNQMTFHYKHKECYYFLKVDGNTLSLEKDTCCRMQNNLTESHWFEKVNVSGGKYYGLRAVGDQELYLCRSKSIPNKHFSITPNYADCVYFTDERIN